MSCEQDYNQNQEFLNINQEFNQETIQQQNETLIQQPQQKNSKQKKMNVLQLTMISYVLICSGSYGIECTVKAGGLIYSIVGVILTTFLLSATQALVCSILSIFYPNNGSTVQWLDCVKFKNQNIKKYIKIFYANTLTLKAIIDNSTYPAMFSDYLYQYLNLYHININQNYKLLISIILILCCFIINIFGIHFVEAVQYIFTTLTTIPIFIECFVAYTKYPEEKVQMQQPEKIDWSLMLSTLLWCCSGFDQLTDLSGEVYELKNHEKQYSIAFFNVCILQTIIYLLPIISLYFVQPDTNFWDNGAFVQIANQIGGQWLAILLTIGGCMSAFGIANNCITCTMYEFQESCQQNLMPFSNYIKIIPKCLKIKTPIFSLIVVTLIPMILSMFGFEIIVKLDAFLIAIAMCICVILYWIRVSQSSLQDQQLQLSKTKKIVFYIIGIIPFVVNLILFIVEGWIPIVGYLICQVILFLLYFIYDYICVKQQCKNKKEKQISEQQVSQQQIYIPLEENK